MSKQCPCKTPVEKILISACLVGQAVRYDGKIVKCDHPLLHKWKQEHRLIPICPEVAGGLNVPRPPVEINSKNGYAVLQKEAVILTKEGQDFTQAFVQGAEHTLHMAREHHCHVAILTEKSPSCGRHLIYDGSFNGIRKEGIGVTAALLGQNGVRVFNQFELEEVEKLINVNGLH